MLAALLAFAGVAAIINITPGLDTMLVLRTSVAGGRATGLVSGLGINTGCPVNLVVDRSS
jgi:threonine/homoserine/homoserine lactone efflux protein